MPKKFFRQDCGAKVQLNSSDCDCDCLPRDQHTSTSPQSRRVPQTGAYCYFLLFLLLFVIAIAIVIVYLVTNTPRLLLNLAEYLRQVVIVIIGYFLLLFVNVYYRDCYCYCLPRD